MNDQITLQAALNGGRTNPTVPHMPEELAIEARAAVDAGATSLHLHPYDKYGRETIAPEPCAAALHAVRSTCPGIPISLSTSADIEPDPEQRHKLIASWTELQDLVTANQGEKGIHELCELLNERDIGIEAGLLSLEDARIFVTSDIAPQCIRAMVEPLDSNPDGAVAHAEAIERTLDEAEIDIEQVHHGDGTASWAVNRRAVAQGYVIRTGLEDTTVLPDGRTASGNCELVDAATSILAENNHRTKPSM